MRHRQRRGINDNQLPSQLSCVAHGCRRAAAPFAVVNRQHNRGVTDKETISLQHTVFLVCAVDEDNGICLLQDGAVLLPQRRRPLCTLRRTGKDAVQLQRRIILSEVEDDLRRPNINVMQSFA